LTSPEYFWTRRLRQKYLTRDISKLEIQSFSRKKIFEGETKKEIFCSDEESRRGFFVERHPTSRQRRGVTDKHHSRDNLLEDQEKRTTIIKRDTRASFNLNYENETTTVNQRFQDVLEKDKALPLNGSFPKLTSQ